MKVKFILGGFCLAVLGLIGCRDVTYNIIEEISATWESETPKPFKALGQATLYAENNGQLILPADEDDLGKDSIPHNYKYRIPTAAVIPAGATLPNGLKVGSMGRLVVSGDARWGDNTAVGGGLDAPQKASTWVRYSDDGGKTWSPVSLAIHFDDLNMETFAKTNVKWGVSTCDPTIGRTANNRLIILSTFCPPAVGGHMSSSGGFARSGDGYFQTESCASSCNPGDNWCRCPDAKWFLRLRKNDKNYSSMQEQLQDVDGLAGGVSTEPKADSFNGEDWTVEQYEATDNQYTYYVSVEGGQIMKGSGNGREGFTGTGLYVDEHYFVYLDAEKRHPFYVSQLEQEGSAGAGRSDSARVRPGDKKVHCHLFMAMSPYLPWRGCNYIGMSYSDDGGVTWSKHKDITYMVRPKENSANKTGVFFISPTGGYLHEGVDGDKASAVGGNKRLLFSAYKSNWGVGSSQQPAVFWTDDEGKTWHHATDGGGGQGAYIGAGSQASETTIVGHPSGALITISRGSPPRYAVSLDGGKTWKDKGELPHASGKLVSNNLISATRLRLSTSPTGDPLIALSSATGSGVTRVNGKVYLATIRPEGDSYTLDPYWMGSATSVPVQDSVSNKYGYSCVCEMPDGNLTVIFESNDCDDLILAYVEVEREE